MDAGIQSCHLSDWVGEEDVGAADVDRNGPGLLRIGRINLAIDRNRIVGIGAAKPARFRIKTIRYPVMVILRFCISQLLV